MELLLSGANKNVAMVFHGSWSPRSFSSDFIRCRSTFSFCADSS